MVVVTPCDGLGSCYCRCGDTESTSSSPSRTIWQPIDCERMETCVDACQTTNSLTAQQDNNNGDNGMQLTLAGYSGTSCLGSPTAHEYYQSGGCTARAPNETHPVAYGFVCDDDKQLIYLKQFWISRTCGGPLYSESVTPNGECFKNTLGGSSKWSGCEKSSKAMLTIGVGVGAGIVACIITIVIVIRRRRAQKRYLETNSLIGNSDGTTDSSTEEGIPASGYAIAASAPVNGYHQPGFAYAQPYGHTTTS